MVGDDMIFTKQIINLIGTDDVGKITHGVEYQGQPMLNWIAFAPHCTRNMISSICFDKPVHCSRCSHPYTFWRGIWIGCRDRLGEGEVFVDTIGYEHHESRHPIVVSPSLAQRIASGFPRKGYSLQPIHDSASKLGELITFICRFIDEQRQDTPPR
jgi:hypothetical protein